MKMINATLSYLLQNCVSFICFPDKNSEKVFFPKLESSSRPGPARCYATVQWRISNPALSYLLTGKRDMLKIQHQSVPTTVRDGKFRPTQLRLKLKVIMHNYLFALQLWHGCKSSNCNSEWCRVQFSGRIVMCYVLCNKKVDFDVDLLPQEFEPQANNK